MTSVSRDKISSCSCGFIKFNKAKLLPFDHLPFLLFQNWLYIYVELELLQSTFQLMSAFPLL